MKKLKKLRVAYFVKTRKMQQWLNAACHADDLVESGASWNNQEVLLGYEQFARYCHFDVTVK